MNRIIIPCYPYGGVTHPFNQEEDEGSHHGLVHAVVLLIHVLLVLDVVVSPGGPGSEDDDRAPDEHDEVHQSHHSAGHFVDGHSDLLSAVDLAIPLSTLLVELGPGVDGCQDMNDIEEDSNSIYQTYSWRPGHRYQPRTASRPLH